MIERNPEWRAILKINAHFALGTLCLGAAWLAWSNVTKEWWQLYIFAVLVGLTGVLQVLDGMRHLWRFFSRSRQLARMKRMGGVPRADHLASEDDLRKRGMIR
ncbi:hypothetical protein [Pseudoroseicyclus sp. CXY001]|uniref:hypothetical protein n=1 Tax=Pseudoroseicyclus sp. CXY001 TaxID=3242492 RepID=UPI003570DBA8